MRRHLLHPPLLHRQAQPHENALKWSSQSPVWPTGHRGLCSAPAQAISLVDEVQETSQYDRRRGVAPSVTGTGEPIAVSRSRFACHDALGSNSGPGDVFGLRLQGVPPCGRGSSTPAVAAFAASPRRTARLHTRREATTWRRHVVLSLCGPRVPGARPLGRVQRVSRRVAFGRWDSLDRGPRREGRGA